jgi:uncharacterized membrane protein
MPDNKELDIQDKPERRTEFDIIRGLALLFMVVEHVFSLFSDQQVQLSPLGSLAAILGSWPAAPVFLFLLGVHLAYSRKQSARQLMVRGLQLLALGYLLSALRFFLPLIVGSTYLGIDPALVAYSWKPTEYLYAFDILHLAGLSLLALSAFKSAKLSSKYYLFAGLAASLLSPLVWFFAGGSVWLTPFSGNAQNIIFPVFSWIFYPLCGAYFGERFKRSVNKELFYKRLLPVATSLVSVGLILVSVWPEPFFGTYQKHGFGGNMLFLGLVFLWLLFIVRFKNKLPKIISDRLSCWSRSVTVFYFSHWLFIGWLAVFWNHKLGYLGSLAMIFLTCVIADRSSAVYQYLRNKFA